MKENAGKLAKIQKERKKTTTKLFCQFISSVPDKHSQVDIFYTDFSKTFNKFNHQILLDKLVDQTLYTFLESYLYNRCQYVDLNGFVYSEFNPSSGALQGSILWLLLFNIFNNFVKHLRGVCLLYANDLEIYSVVKHISECLALQPNLKIYKIDDLIESENPLYFKVSFNQKESPPIRYLSKSLCNF